MQHWQLNSPLLRLQSEYSMFRAYFIIQLVMTKPQSEQALGVWLTLKSLLTGRQDSIFTFVHHFLFSKSVFENVLAA